MSISKANSSTEIQNNFGQILKDVIQNITCYIIKRYNLPQSIILSIGGFEQLLTNQKEQGKIDQLVREKVSVYKIGETIEGK